MNITDDIIIAGIGLYPVGEHWDISLRKMGARAVRAAITDSGGLQPQGLFVGNAFASILSHQSNLAALIADEAGLTGVEACAFEAAGASGGAAVRAAYLAVKSGFLDCTVALGIEKITENTGTKAAETQDLMLNYEYETTAGMTIPSGAALLARRYMVEYGLDRDVLDCMSLNAYSQACGNPNAFYHLRLNEEKLQHQPLSNAPLGMFDCAALCDGAAALVIARRDKLSEKFAHLPVSIIGSANAEAVTALKADEAWTGLTAVKNDAVYANPSGVFAWDRYSGEEALQVLWAAKLLNPDKFADINIEQETKDFYKLFYGCELTDDQVNRILTGENPA